MLAGNGQATGKALYSPLLAEERKRMELLQQQVAALTSKLVDMERKVARREGPEDVSDVAATRSVDPLGDEESLAGVMPQQSEIDHSWNRSRMKTEYFGTANEDELTKMRTRRPDEDFFMDVISVFDRAVPGWNEASIDAAGILDLHAGSVARTVPFMAIVLVVPAYMVLPIASLRLIFSRGAATLEDRVRGLLRSALMCWFAWAPLLYGISGTIWQDVRRHETTFLTFSFPWWALAWFGYAVANQHLVKACDMAVETMKEQVANVKYQNQRAAYGPSSGESWFSDTMQALASPSDDKSLYPMFLMCAEDEPATETLDKWKLVPIIALVSLQVVYALYPCIDAKCGPWALAINVTSAVSIGYAAFSFCHDLGVKMVEFKDCVDEVRTFLFMVSPPEVRMSRRRRGEFLSLIVENVRNRRNFKVTRSERTIGCPTTAWKRTIKKLYHNNRIGLFPSSHELDLEVRRVELNLSTVPGVALFRHLQGWVWADIVNERFAIDTSASIICVMVVLLMGVALAPVVFEKQLAITRVSVTQGVAIVDIAAMLVYIGLCCNYCINMNELIYDHSDRVLMQWKDHARLPTETVARVYADGRVKDLRAPRQEIEGRNSNHRGPMEVRAMIDLTRERLLLQEPQEILGMKVTPALRAKLLSTLGGATLAVAGSMLRKHYLGGT